MFVSTSKPKGNVTYYFWCSSTGVSCVSNETIWQNLSFVDLAIGPCKNVVVLVTYAFVFKVTSPCRFESACFCNEWMDFDQTLVYHYIVETDPKYFIIFFLFFFSLISHFQVSSNLGCTLCLGTKWLFWSELVHYIIQAWRSGHLGFQDLGLRL